MLAFSTCWNARRHTKGESLVEEILELGFDTIELSHNLRNFHLEGILTMVGRGDIRVGSVHNFCPLPPEIVEVSPDCYQFTSHQEEERQRALRRTRETIQLAARVSSPRVVLHGGKTSSALSYRRARQLIREGHVLDRKYAREKLQWVRKRESVSALYLGRLRAALDELQQPAREAGVKLALENRPAYEDVPSEREMIPFIESFPGDVIGYWHDFGHAGIKENLRFHNQAQWLKQSGRHVVGCHLHDVSWPWEDHLPPFSGQLDFDGLIPLLPKDTYMAFEISPDATAEEIRQSRARWREVFGQ
jgi:sugar phosphate isomerase/epimerase